MGGDVYRPAKDAEIARNAALRSAPTLLVTDPRTVSDARSATIGG